MSESLICIKGPPIIRTIVIYSLYTISLVHLSYKFLGHPLLVYQCSFQQLFTSFSGLREKQHRKKLSLEWEVVRLCEDLESAGRQLEAEARWREKAAAEHKIQLAANTNLRCK